MIIFITEYVQKIIPGPPLWGFKTQKTWQLNGKHGTSASAYCLGNNTDQTRLMNSDLCTGVGTFDTISVEFAVVQKFKTTPNLCVQVFIGLVCSL